MAHFSFSIFSTLCPFVIFLIFVLTAGLGDSRPSVSENNHVVLKSRKLSYNSIDQYKSFHSLSLQKRAPPAACTPLPLKNDTWIALELDLYLQQFPGGNNMTLIDYATSVGASNFVCGIGAVCRAGQACSPVREIDWYILFAIQQWNTHVNAMYTSVGIAIQVASEKLTSMVDKLFPASDASGIIQAKQSLGISAGLAEVSDTLTMSVMILFGIATGPVGWALNLINFAVAAGMAIYAYQLKEPPQPIKNGFDVFSHMSWYLDQIQTNGQNIISDAAKKVINSPISSKDGISGALVGGQYMNPLALPTVQQAQEHIYNVTVALGLNFMLRTMNAFITVGADYCDDKGPNGAWPQDDRLSYCETQGGPMHNIIRAKGDKSENGFTNAKLIEQLWGFSTKMITQVSMNCQNKYKTFGYNPYTKGNFPKAPDDDCVFNLPVCDCNEPETHRSIHKKNQHVAEACRKHGHLPI